MDEQAFLHYKIQVEPPMMAALDQVESDAAAFGITADQVNRATYRWVMERMQAGPVPQWYFEEMDELRELLKEKQAE